MVRSRRPFVRSRSARRLQWQSNGPQSLSGGYATQKQVLSVIDFGDFNTMTEPTLVRVRGYVYFSIVSTTNATATGRITCGLLVADGGMPAFNFPDPNDVASADRNWLWLGSTIVGIRGDNIQTWTSTGALSAGVFSQLNHHAGDHFVRWEVNTKAMRKVPRGHSLNWVIKTDLIAGAADYRWDSYVRGLVKE